MGRETVQEVRRRMKEREREKGRDREREKKRWEMGGEQVREGKR